MKRSLRETLKSKQEGNETEMEPVGLSSDKVSHSYENHDLSKLVGRFSGKSDEELMRELNKLTAKQRAEGAFDINDIQQSVNRIAHMLNEEQRRRLNDIIKNL